MTREENYCAGKTRGERWAEHDMLDGLSVQHATLADLTIEARIAVVGLPMEDHERAYALGMLRGYRSTVRTLRNGRWGT